MEVTTSSPVPSQQPSSTAKKNQVAELLLEGTGNNRYWYRLQALTGGCGGGGEENSSSRTSLSLFLPLVIHPSAGSHH